MENDSFDEVLISPVMIQDHMPDKVLQALQKVGPHWGLAGQHGRVFVALPPPDVAGLLTARPDSGGYSGARSGIKRLPRIDYGSLLCRCSVVLRIESYFW